MKQKRLGIGMIVQVDGEYGIITEVSENNANIEWFNINSELDNAWWYPEDLTIIEDPTKKYRKKLCYYIQWADGTKTCYKNINSLINKLEQISEEQQWEDSELYGIFEITDMDADGLHDCFCEGANEVEVRFVDCKGKTHKNEITIIRKQQ